MKQRPASLGTRSGTSDIGVNDRGPGLGPLREQIGSRDSKRRRSPGEDQRQGAAADDRHPQQVRLRKACGAVSERGDAVHMGMRMRRIGCERVKTRNALFDD